MKIKVKVDVLSAKHENMDNEEVDFQLTALDAQRLKTGKHKIIHNEDGTYQLSVKVTYTEEIDDVDTFDEIKSECAKQLQMAVLHILLESYEVNSDIIIDVYDGRKKKATYKYAFEKYKSANGIL